MPHNTSQWVNHTIDGGWATDFGTTHYATPQNGSLSIPWCNTCENVRFYPDGSFGKYPGVSSSTTYPIKAPQSENEYIESSVVRHLYDFTRMGSSLTGTTKRVAVVGSWLYNIDSTLGPTIIGDLSTSSTAIHQMSTFNDLLVIGSPGNPRSWDQTTYQPLAGTPPSFQFSAPHAGRHWAAGVAAAPSRLYYSAVGNPEDWAGAGSGSIDIDPGDGDSIVALLSWKRELWVFKGPNRLSIHRITGTSPSDFARQPFVTGISAAGPMSIFPVGDDFAFWSPRGSCHSLTTTANYGDYIQAYVNFPILSWCRNTNNVSTGSAGYYWQAVTDAAQNISYSVLNNYNGTPLLLAFDWRFRNETNPYPRISPIKLSRDITAVGLSLDLAGSGQTRMAFGDTQGNILQENTPDSNRFYDGDNAISYKIETPALTYGPPVFMKTITGVSVDVVSNYNPANTEYGELDFSYGGPGAPGQTIVFSNPGGVGLGTFVLGSDQLGSIGNIPHYSEVANGEARSFTYTLVEDDPLDFGVGNHVRVKQFGVLLAPGGENMENL